jgi:hypothetical protein
VRRRSFLKGSGIVTVAVATVNEQRTPQKYGI